MGQKLAPHVGPDRIMVNMLWLFLTMSSSGECCLKEAISLCLIEVNCISRWATQRKLKFEYKNRSMQNTRDLESRKERVCIAVFFIERTGCLPSSLYLYNGVVSG